MCLENVKRDSHWQGQVPYEFEIPLKNLKERDYEMKKFYIIANGLKDTDLKVTNKIVNVLKRKFLSYKVNSDLNTAKNGNISYTNKNDIDADTDCIIVIGGDGTLIQAARDLADVDIPMIGVNLGHLGYLAEIEQDHIEDTISMIIDNNYKIESRIMLNGSVYRNDTKIYEDIAFNDIVLGRAGNLRIIDFKVYVNDEYLNLYSADGIIISTPTGSTAYNLSAGGPILEPSANIMAITPICSHTLGARSIVLSADSDIKIKICSNRHIDDNDTKVYFDGNSSYMLKEGDVIKISKSNLVTKIMKLNRMSFVEVLHKKMN